MSCGLLRRRVMRRGVSLIELAVATALTGVLMVAALQTAGQAVSARRQAADRSVAHSLASSLLTEIRGLPYRDPSLTGEPAIGRDSGEVAGARTMFDDVDDYHGLVETPPQARDGSVLANTAGWSRSVSVNWVAAGDLRTTSSASGAKRITVVATYNGVAVISMSAVRTDGY